MTIASSAAAFCKGIQHFGDPSPEFDQYGQTPAIATGKEFVDPTDTAAVYQTMLYADALRYLMLQMTASKSSGHPGGFASQAEAYASLVLLGHKNFVTEVGHHAPGFYAAMFLDLIARSNGDQNGSGLARSLPGAAWVARTLVRTDPRSTRTSGAPGSRSTLCNGGSVAQSWRLISLHNW